MWYRRQFALRGVTNRRVVMALAGMFGAMTVAALAWWFAVGSRTIGKNNDALAVAPPEPWNPPSTEGYLGSTACAECHGDLVESYQTHPMSQSISLVDFNAEDATVPRGDTKVVGQTRMYDVEVRDGTMIHHEKMFDDEGELIYDQGHVVDFVVGSGQRAKAYLHQEGDLLFMSPLNWYTKSQKWDMAPSYTPDDPRRFSRRITDDCLSCHAGRLAPKGRSLNRFQEPAFHEMAIGCENCHGPGQQHVAFHRNGRPSDDARDPIVNPARLDHQRRDSVCFQCHLIAKFRLPRLGRSDFDFRPGGLLSEIWTVLDVGSEIGLDGRTKSINQVQQMLDSRCYTASNGELGCISCHDPHRSPSEAEKVSFYREKCLQCHDDDSCNLSRPQRMTRNNSCVACHMPSRDASNISHVTQTDHRIIRDFETPAISPDRPVKQELTTFEGMRDDFPAWDRERAELLASLSLPIESGATTPALAAQKLLELVEQAPDDGVALNVLGSVAAANNRIDVAIDYHERARNIARSEESALSSLLDLYYARRNLEKVIECADRMIEIDPFDTKAYTLRADALAMTGRVEEGVASAEKALEINPTLTPVREWLIRAYEVTGRTEDRDQQLLLLQRMRDAHPPR